MPPDTPKSYDPAEIVTCRPPGEWWQLVWATVFFGAIAGTGALLPAAPSSLHPVQEAIFFGTVSVASLFAAAWLTWWTLKARILADASGLRWRGGFGWKSARWEGVQDFYDRLPVQSGRDSLQAVIKTSSGTVSFGRQWTNVGPLRALVARRVTDAAASEWGLLGTRPCDPWPRVFRYDTWQNVWTPCIILKLVLTGFGYTFVKPVQQAAGLAGLVGWPMKLALFAPYLILLLLYAGPVLFVLAQYRAAGRRRAERITADTEGIVFEDGARRIEAAWADLTGYEVASGALSARYVVETRRGDFDFLAALSGAMLLKAIIQRYAQDAADEEWRARVDPEALGGEAARWSGGRVGVGARVYHSRTRAHRAMLGLPLGMCLTMGFVCWATSQGLTPGTGLAGSVCGALFFGLMFVGCRHTHRVYRIETDADGLTRITPLGRRRLAWDQVEDYWLTSEGGGVVAGRGERLSFGSGIVGRDELKEETARRAVNCGGRAWERKPTRTAPDARRRGRTGPESSGPG